MTCLIGFNGLKGYEKLNYDNLKEEAYEVKEYMKTMNLYDARMKFSIWSKMVKTR